MYGIKKHQNNWRQWELETADNCKLPQLIPDICEKCRDYAYCHRQKTWEDFRRENSNERHDKQTGCD